jgi:hypothetical protein
MGFLEQCQTKYYALPMSQRFEMSLVQAWYPSLLYTTCGVAYNAAANTFVADTSQSNKILTIVDKAQGPTSAVWGDNLGGVGDIGARVIVSVTTATALIAS